MELHSDFLTEKWNNLRYHELTLCSLAHTLDETKKKNHITAANDYYNNVLIVWLLFSINR